MMSKIVFFLACVACVQVGRADISYQTTLKQGPAAGATTQFKIKGLKVRIEGREGITLVDLGARTITVLRPVDKTYTVRAIEEGAVGVKKSPGALRTAVKETGVTRKIGNYRCRQVVMTMTMAGGPLSLTMENEMWVSRDVPGFEEWRAATQKMADKAIAPVVADGPARKMLADMQRDMAKVNGAPVLQITRMKMDRGGMNPQMQGGPGGNLMETMTEWGGYSTAVLAGSEFEIPAGYRKAAK